MAKMNWNKTKKLGELVPIDDKDKPTYTKYTSSFWNKVIED